MRTLIQGGDVVAFDGRGHRLLRDGVVVFEGTTIVAVGPSYEGPVDRRIDARGTLVAPGFVNTHVHVGVEVMTALLDVDRRGPGRWISPSRRYVSGPPERSLTEEEQRISGEFGLVQLLKAGTTTLLDVVGSGTLWWLGNPPGDIEIFADTVGRLGARAYLSPGYRSYRVHTDESGQRGYFMTERQGFGGLQQAVRFIEGFHGAHGGRVQGMLYPHAVDNCTPDLLRETKRAAKALGVGIQIHAAQSVGEVEVVRERTGLTPIELLADIGFLGPEVLLGHCVFIRGHSSVGGVKEGDLSLIAASGAAVAHSPRPFARQGVALESFQQYLDAGVTMTIGTDIWPVDIISEMRLASLLCKVVDKDPRAASAA
ncbi:MAG: amidohydrolase family protein, partial [Armatimonadetes bacterium]|nr:amidohydrolase family protein [Armatimonadota bacterium]